MLRLVILSSILGLSVPYAAAAKKDPLAAQCPSANALAKEVYICDDNAEVAKVAQECGNAAIASWKLAAEALKPLLEPADSKNASQDQSLRNTLQDYQKAILVLDRQIEQLQLHTDLVASYPDIMIDYPEGVDDATSAECFNKAFHSVQSTVSKLDDEIIRAKAARDHAEELAARTQTADKGMTNASNRNETAKAGPRSAPAPVIPKKKHKRPESDITGLQQQEPGFLDPKPTKK